MVFGMLPKLAREQFATKESNYLVTMLKYILHFCIAFPNKNNIFLRKVIIDHKYILRSEYCGFQMNFMNCLKKPLYSEN